MAATRSQLIYYAMVGGEVAAHAVSAALKTGRAKHLQLARRLLMREHKQVFRVLGAML